MSQGLVTSGQVKLEQMSWRGSLKVYKIWSNVCASSDFNQAAADAASPKRFVADVAQNFKRKIDGPVEGGNRLARVRPRDSVTRLADFRKVLETNFLAKVA